MSGARLVAMAGVAALGLGLLVVPATLVLYWVSSAEERLEQADLAPGEAPAVATAAAANEAYCTPELQRVLRRVLTSCGLVGEGASGGGRGCQPVQARQVATMRGSDFNALFLPMAERAGIVQFDRDSAELDQSGRQLVEQVFAERGGASYFFVVSRASPEGSVRHNRELSRERAEAVMGHLQQTFQDPELDRQVGLLWLGEEYAQLESDFCQWRRSGPPGACRPEDLNRSAFIAWIECRL